ncbi:hypothetical protein BaRGS_00010062, partial [Batillaria attramentaria]
ALSRTTRHRRYLLERGQSYFAAGRAESNHKPIQKSTRPISIRRADSTRPARKPSTEDPESD